ncbi:MAG: tetratricopeptide repeat protein [bacterium]|nr:tetratricopeptide repeat protein [bacterium]
MPHKETTTVEVTEEVYVESSESPTTPAISRLFDRISLWLTGAVLVLTPLIIGFGSLSTVFAKHAFLVIAVSLAGTMWLIARITSAQIVFPKSGLLLGLVVLVVSLVPATLFSGTFSLSFAGLGGETGTLMSIISYATALLLVAVHVRSPQSIVSYLLYLIGFGIVVFVVQAIGVFFGPFDIIGSTGSLIGKWNDTSVFYGLVTVLSLAFLGIVGVSGMYRALVYVSLATSLVGLVVTNLPAAWNVVALLAVLVTIAQFVRSRSGEEAGFQMSSIFAPLVVLVVAIVFSIFGNADGAIGSRIVDFQLNRDISTLEARPSFRSTMVVLGATYDGSAVLGSGLNRFAESWVSYRPDSVNESPFWNIAFNAGIGYFPTFAVTAGVVGAIGVLIFMASFLVGGIRLSFSRGSHHEAHATLLTLFLSALYLLTIQTIYVTDSFLIGLSFIFAGLLIATGVITGKTQEVSLRLFTDARIRFISMVVLVFLLVTSIGIGYTGIQRARAVRSFVAAQAARADGDLDAAHAHLTATIGYAPVDEYYRALADLETRRLGDILARTDLTPDQMRARFQELLGRAVDATSAAIAYNENNFFNYIQLGRLYTSLVPLQFSDAYDLANEQYLEAEKRAEGYPLIAYERARLESIAENEQEARRLFDVALERKANYTDALFALALVELNSGNVDKAIERTQSVATLTPNNEAIFFQLGFLLYQRQEYRDAGTALQRAVALNSNYSNALYFLGLVYEELGFHDDAIAQFERVLQLNPDNTEVGDVLGNLRAGLPPLRGIDAPVETGELPIEE